MIDKLKQFFSTTLDTDAALANKEQTKTLAAVALMIEIIAVDDEQHDAEKNMLRHLLSTQFSVTDEAATKLLEQASHRRSEATDYYGFTSEINRHFTPHEKIELIESLWRLAWADNEIHELEQHVIRRLANLLHVSHKDFIATKLAVTEERSL